MCNSEIIFISSIWDTFLFQFSFNFSKIVANGPMRNCAGFPIYLLQKWVQNAVQFAAQSSLYLAQSYFKEWASSHLTGPPIPRATVLGLSSAAARMAPIMIKCRARE